MRMTLKARECGTEIESACILWPFLAVLGAFLAFCGRLLGLDGDNAL